MNNIFIIIYSILIVSFIISLFIKDNINVTDINYKVDSKITFYISCLNWSIFIFGLLLNNNYMIYLFYISQIIVIVYELIIFIFKTNFYSLEYKKILNKKNIEMDIDIIRKEFIAKSIKNIFVVVSAPLILLEKMIDFLLSFIFKN